MLEVASLIASEGDPKGLLVKAWLPFCVGIENKSALDGTAPGSCRLFKNRQSMPGRPILVMS
jgi:hypothetical protein